MSNRPYKWEEKEYDHSYDDIIHLHRPKSKRHPPMPMEARAAQFSPYAALVGYSDQIAETARITDGRVELSVEEQEMLDKKINLLTEALSAAGKNGEKPTVTILYFIPDKKKDGGAFAEIEGKVRLVDTVNREITLMNDRKETKIRLTDVVDLTGTLFQTLEKMPYVDV